MTRLFLKIILFLSINIPIFFLIANIPMMRFHFTNETNKSVILTMPSAENYDVLIMGTSHARNFSNSGNQTRLEGILKKRVWSIAKDGGHGGVFPELMFLERFYADHNHSNTILYFIDPWVFYSREWNEENYFMEGESVDLPFLRQVIGGGVSKKTVINHLQFKLDPVWFLAKPDSLQPDARKVPSLEFALDGCRQDAIHSYMDGMDHQSFLRYTAMLERTVTLAEENGSRVIFAFPVTLCHVVPGKKEVEGFLAELKTRHHIELYDFSQTMTDPQYFYDYNHLNTKGVELFAAEYLLPIMGSSTMTLAKPGLIRQ